MAKLAPTMFSILALAVASSFPFFPLSSTCSMGVAQAANPMVELVSGGDVTGDGATTVRLHIVAFNSDGSSMTGASLKLAAAGGRTGRVSMVKAGLYAVDWTPPKVSAISDVQLTVKGRSPDKTSINKSWAIAVHPPLDYQVAINANPSEVTLGQDGSATLNIQFSGNDAKNLEDGDLIVQANSGMVKNITHLGGGRFAASYQPPARFFPHVALITVADKRNPNRTYGSLALPLIGKANFPVVGLPNSQVMVRIDEREFGPVPSDANGRVQVPLEVRPGFIEARVISVSNGRKAEEALDLQVPPANRVAFFPVTPALAADPSITMPVRAVVTTPDGRPDEGAKVQFSATAGTVSAAVHEGQGVYRADLTPPFGNQQSEMTLSVEVDDLKSSQFASQNIKLIPARPGSIALTPEPASLLKGAKGFQLLAKVQSADGVGMADRSLRFQANGAKLVGAPLDLGSGDYKARFSTTGNGAVEITATATSDGSDNPFRSLLMFPSRERMPSDGLSSAMLTILSLDEYGYPVGNVAVALKVASGEGSIPAQTTTDGAGIAQVHFTAGRRAGLARIAATAHGQTTMIPLLLAPNKIAKNYGLPASGSEANIALYTAWSKIIQSARLEREGMVGAPIDGFSADNTVGPVSNLSAVAEPTQIAPGGTVVLRINAKDSAGRGTGGQKLQVMATPGQVSAVTDQGGGRYTASITAPAGITGEIKVSIVAPSVGLAETLSLPVTGGNWGSVGMATQQTTTSPVAKKKKRTPRTGAPSIRAQGGLIFGQYHYRQEPTVLLGPMYDFPITFGGNQTSPASTPGIALSASGAIPGFEQYLTARAKLQTTNYRVALPEFADPISDWLTRFEAGALGKAEVLDGQTSAYAGLRMGLGFDDFLVFKQKGNADIRTLSYEPLWVPSLVVGPEVGFDYDDTIFGHAAVNFGLANFATYYSLNLDMQVGYNFMDDMYGYLGADVTRRSLAVYTSLEGEDDAQQVGVLNDHVNLLTMGIGWQM